MDQEAGQRSKSGVGVRPIRFLLNANLPESLQKSDRIHAQSFEVKFGTDVP